MKTMADFILSMPRPHKMFQLVSQSDTSELQRSSREHARKAMVSHECFLGLPGRETTEEEVEETRSVNQHGGAT